MEFPKLTFPMTVAFSGNQYWIGDAGPFPFGAAATAVLAGDRFSSDAGDTKLLTEELEDFLKTIGSHLQPYVKKPDVPDELFRQIEQHTANCVIHYGYLPLPKQKEIAIVEQYTFPSLQDFLYVELGRAILCGNAPRQCRLCGNWFLHVHGDKNMYCERLAPDETGKTCREVGARAVFENKIQNDEAWKLYKRAYKKYYARVMKGSMTRADFSEWVSFASAKRDHTILEMEKQIGNVMRKQLAEKLREELNKL